MADLRILDDTPKSVSRRRFIKGVIGGGATVASSNYLFRAATTLPNGGGGERLITLNVNGRQRRVDVPKQETLAWTLRYKLGLTGTKLGCDRAECGACTVPDRRCAALFMLDAHPYSARPQHRDRRRPGLRRWDAAPGAAGHHRRARFPVRVLHVWLHYGHGGVSENESKSHQSRVGARHFRKLVPVPGL